MQMQAINVSAEMITSFQSKEQIRNIMNQIDKPKSSLSLLYVTPEKIAKSKTFISKLEKAYRDKRLARIIVDEGSLLQPVSILFSNIKKSKFSLIY